ncbi:MAG: ABC transporter permease subunit, partial [Proteobacteria bacterium]|nr:ABC transporter permease subunit [Pseudomonadota bacterium]
MKSTLPHAMAPGKINDSVPHQKAFSISDLWRKECYRSYLFQCFLIGACLLLGWFLLSNTLANLSNRHINTGFGFLNDQAGFSIGETLIDFHPSDPYYLAILVGLLNTCKVSIIAIVISTVLGTIIGIIRLSNNWVIARLASAYVEVVRNIPLLLQLFVWYALLTEMLPHNRHAWNPFAGLFISNRGVFYASLSWDTGYLWALAGSGLGIVAAFVLRWIMTVKRGKMGQPFPIMWAGGGLVILFTILGWLAGGAPTVLDVPVLKGFNYQGGGVISPEFLALVMGLSIYTAGYIAEIVRSGILSVPGG